ncbi:MAG: hypothetical protein ACI4L9_03770 [Candidatus Coproplasma sp.]
MKKSGIAVWLKVLTCASLLCALLLTFTVSDYYIFNRIGQFNFFFVLAQWIKKSSLLLLPLAVFYKKRCCADIAKYVLPPFAILSCFLFGEFFDVTKAAQTPAQEIYNSINLFMPKWLNMTLFFTQNAVTLGACALLFARDGFKINFKSFYWLAPAVLAVMPLNIFENFFDIDEIPKDSFLRFYNFTIWHFLALAALAGVTIALYCFLRKKDDRARDQYLAAVAITLLIQYHSKDSLVLGDGYNVYHTIFACIPLFICNIGVYVASLSVFLKKKPLYAISFFVHAVGALSVFVYFGRDDMSDYGIFCSRSILYFCLTHILLFALSVLPSALGQYKFKMRDCVIPLIYYFIVIILASVCSALVTSASMGWHTEDGYFLAPEELLYPNYAFTQINPLPFEVPPVITLTIWKYEVNVLYVLGLYAVYVGLFFAFTGLYYAFLALRKRFLLRSAAQGVSANPTLPPVENGLTEVQSEAAATDEDK